MLLFTLLGIIGIVSGKPKVIESIVGGSCYIKPIFHCATANKDGSLTAHMGYQTECIGGATTGDVDAYRIPIGDINKFIPEPISRGQPELFLVGRHENAFAVELSRNEVARIISDDLEENLWWKITGRMAKIIPNVKCNDKFRNKINE